MIFRLERCVIAAACALACSAATIPAWAQSDAPQANDGDALFRTLQSMQEEMDRLRKDNQSMRGEIDELRARTEDNWLTEERATQIRGLVEDVLADADSRATMLNDGVMAGWSEHFFLADAFGRFLLQFEGLVQTRFIYNYREPQFSLPDRSRYGFDIPRARMTFRGHIYNENLQYLIRGEWSPVQSYGVAAGAFLLLDSWLRYDLTNEWSVRAGQFKLPFLREDLVSESMQMAVGQSLVAEGTSLGRSIGLEFAYHDTANAFNIAFSNGMSNRQAQGVLTALMGGPRINRPAIGENVEYAVSLRYERLLAGSWKQFEDFTSPMGDEFGMLLGFAGHAQNNESNNAQLIGESEPLSLSATADFSIEWGGANAFASATYHYIDSPTAQIVHFVGLVGHVGVYVAPKWELFARGEWQQVENVSGGNTQISDMGIITVGANYYIEGHDIKWTTDVGFAVTPIEAIFASELLGWREATGSGIPEVVFRTQIQIVF